MAGILDSKTRFIDFLITQEGRRQLAAGKMKAEYASITDNNTFYDKNEHDNVNDRIYLWSLLDEFMKNNNYEYVRATDTGVGFNRR